MLTIIFIFLTSTRWEPFIFIVSASASARHRLSLHLPPLVPCVHFLGLYIISPTHENHRMQARTTDQPHASSIAENEQFQRMKTKQQHVNPTWLYCNMQNSNMKTKHENHCNMTRVQHANNAWKPNSNMQNQVHLQRPMPILQYCGTSSTRASWDGTAQGAWRRPPCVRMVRQVQERQHREHILSIANIT